MNYADQQRSPMRHIVGLILVILFHIALIYALVNGLGKNIVDIIKQPLEAKIIKDNKPPPPEAPPPPPPQLVAPPPPYIPPPDIQIQAPAQSTAITEVTHTAPPPGPVQVERPVQAAPDHDVSERPIGGAQAPVYPPDMIDEEREGAVTVTCNVDTSGTTADCSTSNVVGGASFARSALVFAQGHRYAPATHNGVAVSSRKSWRLNFKLAE